MNSPKQKFEHAAVVVLSAFLSLACVLLAVCTRPRSEINDDAGVQWIVGTIGDFSPYQHPLLAVVTKWFSLRWPGLNWFVILQFVVIFFGLWAMLWAIWRMGGRRACLPGWAVCLAAVWCGGLKYWTFTRTSPIMLSAGCMVAMAVMMGKQKPVSGLLIANALLVPGVMFRYEGVLAIFPFFGLLGLFLTAQKQEDPVKWLLGILRRGAVLWGSMAFALAVLGAGRLYLAFVPGWEDYLDFDMARGQIQDFESQDRWGQGEDAYRALGLEQIDFKMLQSWNTEDTDFFTTELLQQVAKQRHGPEKLTHWVDVIADSAEESGLWMIVPAALILMALTGFSSLLPLAASVAGMAFLVIFQIVTGRVVPRSLDAVLMGLLFAAVSWYALRRTDDRTAAGIRMAAAACVLLCAVPVWQSRGKFTIPDLNYGMKKSKHEALQKIEEDEEHIYILTCSAGLYLDEACGMWGAIPMGEAENLFWLGDCYMRAPKVREKLREKGIENPMRALFEDERVYSSNSETVLTYLQTHYDPNMVCTVIDDTQFYDVVQYSYG